MSTKSLYKLLKDEFSIYPTFAEEEIEVVHAEESVAKILGIKEGDCVLSIVRITFSQEKIPIEYVYSNYRKDNFKTQGHFESQVNLMFSESFKMLLLGTLTLSQFVSMMSIEQKIGQLFLFGFQGISYNDQIQLLIDKRVRGFVIFGRNVKDKDQVKELVEQIKTHCDDIPPFVAVDQEGGMVARIRDIFVPPNAMLLGSVNDTELTYKVGYLTGKALRDLGINMDFAPVLDVNSNP